MIEISTDFPYLGPRDYIHGTSILSGFLEALERDGHGRISVKRLKFQRPATSNGRLLLTTGAVDEIQAERASCTFQANGGGALWRGLFEERGAAVGRRIAVTYPIENLEAQGFGGSCTIAPADRDDLIRAFVEANKRFHEASVDSPARSVRFGYLEGWTPPAADIRFTGTLDAKNLITRKTDDGYMTINRLEDSDASGAASTLTLCFNVTIARTQ